MCGAVVANSASSCVFSTCAVTDEDRDLHLSSLDESMGGSDIRYEELSHGEPTSVSSPAAAPPRNFLSGIFGSAASASSASKQEVNVAAAAMASSLPLYSGLTGSRTAAPASQQYLAFERRTLTNQMSYNTGYSYFTGLLLGGAYGLVHGVTSSPNARPRILLNSILNGCGKYGAKMGNSAGIVAMIYTIVERSGEEWEVDKLPGSINNLIGYDLLGKYRYDWAIPVASAFTTGVLFTLPRAGTHSPSSYCNTSTHTSIQPLSPICAVTMKGLDKHYITFPKRLAVVTAGGLATVAGVAALAVIGPYIYGKRSPYRFAN
jgi:hypothetical protein